MNPTRRAARIEQGENQIVECSCRLTTEIQQTDGRHFAPVNPTWTVNQHGWHCGQEGHRQISVRVLELESQRESINTPPDLRQ